MAETIQPFNANIQPIFNGAEKRLLDHFDFIISNE